MKRNNVLVTLKKKKRLRICFVVSSSAILPIFSAEWFLPQQCNDYILLSLSFGEEKKFCLQMKNLRGVNLLFPHINCLNVFCV